MGWYLLRFQSRIWFPFKQEKLHKAQIWFKQYGKWSLLLAWLPIGGDALTFIAGVMRLNLSMFLCLVSIGKGTRYMIVIFLTDFLNHLLNRYMNLSYYG